jgi:hypothetical protein
MTDCGDVFVVVVWNRYTIFGKASLVAIKTRGEQNKGDLHDKKKFLKNSEGL